jgi:hypothetical protein
MNEHTPTVVVPVGEPNAAMKRRANRLFTRLRKKLVTRDVQSARTEWESIYNAMAQAKRLGGQARFKTENRHGKNNSVRRQVVAAAIASKLIERAAVRTFYMPGRNWR